MARSSTINRIIKFSHCQIPLSSLRNPISVTLRE
jgi:hypothetical protein